MAITFDPAKNERNIRERGLSFERAADFDFGTAAYFIDARREYGEIRVVAYGYLDRRLHSLCSSIPPKHPGHQLPSREPKRGKAIWQSENH